MSFVIPALCLFLIALIGISSLAHGPRAGAERASLFGADARGEGRNSATLWGLIVLAIVYSGLLRYLPALTGVPLLDGGIGVALGLYICAHPAANAVNMLFFERDRLYQMASDWPLDPLAGTEPDRPAGRMDDHLLRDQGAGG